MPSFRTTRAVRQSPEEMFALVCDVERYPEFLPLCESLRVLRREPGTEGKEVLVAEMGIGYKAIRERFITRVTLDQPRLGIVAQYVDGPFKRLENRWAFRPRDGGGCTVEFYIAYEFKSLALGLLMGSVFDRAFRKFTDAFEARANLIYPAPAAPAAG